MFSSTYLAAATAVFSLITSSSAAFNAASKANVAMYWGAGSGQARLSTYCDQANVDIIPLAFINQFQSTANGLVGEDFGNQCWGTPVYSGPGYDGNINTTANYLPVNCPNLQDDIYYCQTQTNKKILLSLGGAPTYDEPAYGLNNVADGINLANFLWNAYGPYNDTYYKAGGLRPLDRGSSNANTSMTIDIDGFDFDIETNSPDEQLGYVACINTLRSLMTAYKKENPCSKDYIISGAPQCPIPDVHMSTIINEAAFDILWIQFYNNDGYGCSAINYTTQGSKSNFNLATGATNWVTTLAGGASKHAKVYIGLPGGPLGVSNAPQDWLTPAEAQALINAFEGTKNFGGVMLWEATAAAAVDMANYAPQYAYYWDAIKAYLNPYAPTTTMTSSICLSTTSTSSTLTSTSSTITTSSSSSLTSSSSSSKITSTSSTQSSFSSSSSSSKVSSSSSVVPTSSSSSFSSSSSQVSSTSSSSSKVSPSSSSSSSSLVSSLSSSSSVVPTSSSSSPSSSLSSSTSSTFLSSSVNVITSSSVVSVTPTSSTSFSSTTSSSGTVTSVPSSYSSVIILSSGSSGNVTPTSSSSWVSSSITPTNSVSGTATSVTSTSSIRPTSSVSGTITSGVSSSSSTSTLSPFSNSTSTVVPSSSLKKSKIKCSSVFPSSSSKVRVSPTSSLSSVSSSVVPTSSNSQATSSSSTQYTTSTVYTTSIYTITSCAPTVTNCPARLGQVTTETIELYTTICPVTETQTNVGIPTTAFSSMAPSPTQYTTSTVYATSIYTITSCAPTVTDCPARLGSVTTEYIKLYTTVCPVTEAAVTASSTPAGSVKAVAVAAEASASSSSILYTTLSSTTTLYKTVLLKLSTATVVALPPTTVVAPYPTGSSTGNVFATGLPSVSLVFSKEVTSTAAGVAVTTNSITPAATNKFTGAASASRAGMSVMFAIVLGAVAVLV